MAHTDIKTEADTLLKSAFEDSMDCEMPLHGDPTIGTHSGKGEWYLTLRCPHCSASKTTLVCGGFRDYVTSMLDTYTGICGKCKQGCNLRRMLISIIWQRG